MITNRGNPAVARGRRHPAGLTFVEIVIALSVFVIAMLGLLALLATSGRQALGTRMETLAYQAARAKIEEIRSQTFADIFKLYNADTTDDPGGPGTAPGPTFDIAGLRAPSGFAAPGSISFPVDNTGAKLLENVTDAELGTPLDLNLDGAVDALDHSGDYKIVPVRVEVRWKGNEGTDRRIYSVTWISER
jgi:Tfp pilus assembly protein PilV